jgi:hypothetical protein
VDELAQSGYFAVRNIGLSFGTLLAVGACAGVLGILGLLTQLEITGDRGEAIQP